MKNEFGLKQQESDYSCLFQAWKSHISAFSATTQSVSMRALRELCLLTSAQEASGPMIRFVQHVVPALMLAQVECRTFILTGVV
jgi:hypothetical protein